MKRIGARKVKVAAARKIAVILHSFWSDGTEFKRRQQKRPVTRTELRPAMTPSGSRRNSKAMLPRSKRKHPFKPNATNNQRVIAGLMQPALVANNTSCHAFGQRNHPSAPIH